jgi:hypothetical protein
MSDNRSIHNNNDQQAANVTSIASAGRGDMEDEHYMERLARTFESSARRWEMVVYPSMFAFIVLAAYGFYLIYNLTHDVASLAGNVSVMTQSLDRMVDDMDHITTNMDTISGNMEAINASTRSMAVNTDAMRYQIGAMNYNIGRPVSQMSSFMPW